MNRIERVVLVGLWLLFVLGAGCAASLKPNPSPLPDGIRFSGTWDSNWGEMELEQEGKAVRGKYAYQGGKLTGDVEGDILNFRWRQGNNQTGRGWLQISQDGEVLEGYWGYGEHESDGGVWEAKRSQKY